MLSKEKYDLKDIFREFGKLGNPGTPDKYFKREKYLFGLLGKKGEEITNGIIYKKNDLGLINWEVCYNNNTKEYEKTWYDNGQLSSEYYYKDGGSLCDWVKKYYENGRLEHEIQTNGNIKWYYKNGKLELEDVVIEGKIIDGQQVYYRKTYYENGVLQYEGERRGRCYGSFSGYIQIGLWKLYNKNGELKTKIIYDEFGEESYVVNSEKLDIEGGNTYNGVPFTGIVHKLYDNGNLMWEGNYQNGEQIGWWKNFYKSGSLESEGNKVKYKNFTRKDGLWKEYYENGNLKSEGNYKKDCFFKEGEWKEYYENGKLHKHQFYINGEKDKILIQLDKNGFMIDPEYEFIISGIDNMSNYGNCNLQLTLNESQWEEFRYDDYYKSTPGGIIELMKHIGYKKEWVMVIRFQIFDKKNNKYYEISEIETFNTSKKNKELTKIYYRYGYVNHPNRVVFQLMNEEEIEEFKNEWDYNLDNRYFGIDVYSIENFDLELELKTDYLGGVIS